VLVALLTTLLFALAVWLIYQLQTIVVRTILALKGGKSRSGACTRWRALP